MSIYLQITKCSLVFISVSSQQLYDLNLVRLEVVSSYNSFSVNFTYTKDMNTLQVIVSRVLTLIWAQPSQKGKMCPHIPDEL
jgi:hypothetical protein